MFFKNLWILVLGETSSLRIGRVNTFASEVHKYYENIEHNSINEVLFENIRRVVVYVYKNQTFSKRYVSKGCFVIKIHVFPCVSDHVYAPI